MEKTGSPDVEIPESQHSLDRAASQVVKNELKHHLKKHHLFCLVLAAQSIGGCWLNVIPVTSVSIFPNGELLRIAVFLRLGLHICQSPLSAWQDFQTFDLNPLTSRLSAGRFARHATLEDVIKRALESGALCNGTGRPRHRRWCDPFPVQKRSIAGLRRYLLGLFRAVFDNRL